MNHSSKYKMQNHIQILKKTKEKNLPDLGFDKDILDMTQKSQ